MKTVLAQFINNPQHPFAFPENFWKRRLVRRSFLPGIFHRIYYVFSKALFYLRNVSGKYQQQFDTAVTAFEREYRDYGRRVQEAPKESEDEIPEEELPALSAEPQLLPHQVCLNGIAEKAHPDLGEIIGILFAAVGVEECAREWDAQNCLLRLNHPLRLWMPSIKNGKQDPKGGIVMLFEEELEFRFSSNRVAFVRGLSIYCKPSIKGVSDATVSLDYLHFYSRDHIGLCAAKRKEVSFGRFSFGVSSFMKEVEEKRAYEELKANWGRQSRRLDQTVDYKRFLKEKYDACN